MTASPWTIALFVLLGLGLGLKIFRAIRWAPITTAAKDPLRRFSYGEKATLLRLAGNRCEFQGIVGGRCRATERLHADHVHPHSRGGSTALGNGQILCSRHNKEKAARIPFEWELRRIAKRRADYYPAGEVRAVVRRMTGANR